MHGLGNDFVIIDARDTAVAMPSARARAIADRREGIGCDQIVLLEASSVADVRMRIFNADGGEVEACGNAARAVAHLLGGAPRIETLAGTITAQRDRGGVTVDMGSPRFEWDAIPIAYPLDTGTLPLAWDGLEQPAAVNVGNPHLVFFVDDCDAIDLARIGPVIEHDPVFPARINVNIAAVTGPSSLDLRVWERGAGLTRACGTGASATAVVALRTGRVTGPVAVTLPGGTLTIDWRAGETIRMSGPATHVFTGTADWSRFGA